MNNKSVITAVFDAYRAYLAARTREMEQIAALDFDTLAALSDDEVWTRWPRTLAYALAMAEGYRRALERNEEVR